VLKRGEKLEFKEGKKKLEEKNLKEKRKIE